MVIYGVEGVKGGGFVYTEDAEASLARRSTIIKLQSDRQHMTQLEQ